MKALFQTTIGFVVIGAMLFVSGGTLAWPAAWFYLALTLAIAFVVVCILARTDPALLMERTSAPIQHDQEGWDRGFFAAFAVLLPAFFVLVGLDARRFGWSHVPVVTQCSGAVGVVVSYAIIYAAFRANSFAAPVVKLQRDRDQRVASEGVYRYVRHPMYAGGTLFFFSTSLELGSWYGLIAGALLGVLVAARSVLEERMLREKLFGYSDYAARVRYRMIPGVW